MVFQNLFIVVWSLFLLSAAMGGTTLAMSPTLGAINQRRDGLYTNSRERSFFSSVHGRAFPGQGMRGGNEMSVVVPRRRRIVVASNVIGLAICVAIIPSVTIPAIRLGATIILAMAVVNLATGHGLIILRP